MVISSAMVYHVHVLSGIISVGSIDIFGNVYGSVIASGCGAVEGARGLPLPAYLSAIVLRKLGPELMDGAVCLVEGSMRNDTKEQAGTDPQSEV